MPRRFPGGLLIIANVLGVALVAALAVAAVAIVRSSSTPHDPLGSLHIVQAPPLSPRETGPFTPTPDPRLEPCPLRTPAERQQWVDQFRAAHPPLRQLPELYDWQFIRVLPHPDALALPLPLPEMVARAQSVTVVRVIAEDLDDAWSPYEGRFLPVGAHFGVAGRSRIAVEQVLKGDPKQAGEPFTLPFFIAADSQCRPIVALGFNEAEAPSSALPVFSGEQTVVFGPVVPIIGGQALAPWLQYGPKPEPARTGQQFIDLLRQLIAAPPRTPTPTPQR